MRTETKSHTYKTFAELSKANQNAIVEKRRDWNVDQDWWTFTYEDAKRIGALFGFEIDDIELSGFWSQGDGARCSGDYRPRKGMCEEVRTYAPQDEELHLIVERLMRIQEKYDWEVNCKVSFSGGLGVNEYCTSFDFGEAGWTEENEDGYSKEIWMSDEDEEEVIAALRRFMHWIYARLENEYEHLTSDDTLRELFLGDDEEFEVRIEDDEEELIW